MPYKLLPSIKNILGARRFFSLSTFIFIAHFSWACVTSQRESRNLYLKHSFSTYSCLSNNLLISAWISTKFVSTLLLCMLYQINNFQHKASTLIYFLHCMLIESITWTPLNDLNKISDTQTILIYESSG